MKDFRDKGRKPRFNQGESKPRRFDQGSSTESKSNAHPKPRPSGQAMMKPARPSPTTTSKLPAPREDRRTFERGADRDRGGAGDRFGDRSSAGNEREFVYGVEPIRELVVASPA